MDRLSSTDTLQESAFKLTQQDVERLVRNPTPELKISIIEKVTHQYNPEHFTRKERELAEQIFRLLLVDAVVKVREALAQNLRDNPNIPRDIIVKLANDVESVATPVLEMSSVLTEEDVLALLGSRHELWCYLAVTRRPNVSERISEALAQSDNSQVFEALLGNQSAQISESSLNHMLDVSNGNSHIVEKMAERDALPLTIVEKVLSYASEKVSEQLTAKYNIDPEQLEAQSRIAREQNTLSLITHRVSRKQTQKLVNQLYDSDRLSVSLVINSLCHGNVEFFEISLARMAGIPVENAHVLIGDKGKLGLRAIYNKSGLPTTMFKAVRILLQAVRETLDSGFKTGTVSFSNAVIGRMLGMAEGEEVENLSYILALLRQHTLKTAA